ncbi:MAG: FMN-binding protein [Tissierellia bacterium]|nr:FMN-binding protein [Tissierellia bacterium]
MKILLICAAAVVLSSCGSAKTYSEDTSVASEPQVQVIETREHRGKLFKDGKYEASAEGYMGAITVEVRVRDGFVDRIRVLEHQESTGIVADAFANLERSVLDAQSTNVDVVAGATESCNGYLEAVGKALERAEQ